MVTDRVGPTITTLKAEVDYLDGEVKKLLNKLADALTEIVRLRAALEPHACDCEGKAICLDKCMRRNARAALDYRKTEKGRT